MNEFKADLHCHSTCSDGSLTPEQLVQHAKNLGFQGLSITDHDTIEAYNTAVPAAKEAGMRLISGVEFSTTLDGVSVHILAYSFPLTHPEIINLCQKHTVRRQMRNRAILEKLSKMGMPISEEELLQVSPRLNYSLGRPHIAMLMVSKGYVPTIQEAFKKYIGEGAPCFATGEPFRVEDTLRIIHEAKGLAVIAHPQLIQDVKTLKNLLEMPFDGMECFYGNFQNQDSKRWIKIAARKNLIMTGGSDFHGKIKPSIPFGCSFIDEKTFEILEKHYIANQ